MPFYDFVFSKISKGLLLYFKFRSTIKSRFDLVQRLDKAKSIAEMLPYTD